MKSVIQGIGLPKLRRTASLAWDGQDDGAAGQISSYFNMDVFYVSRLLVSTGALHAVENPRRTVVTVIYI